MHTMMREMLVERRNAKLLKIKAVDLPMFRSPREFSAVHQNHRERGPHGPHGLPLLTDQGASI